MAPLCLVWPPSDFCSSGPVFVRLVAQDFDTWHTAQNQALQAPKAGAGVWRAALGFSQWPETDGSLASWALGSIFLALSQGQNTNFQVPGSCKACSPSSLRHTRGLEPGLLLFEGSARRPSAQAHGHGHVTWFLCCVRFEAACSWAVF